MADDLALIEPRADDGEDLPLFVRTISLPTSSLRNARSAVELQFDRLSPLPRALATFDVVGLKGVGGANRYAVGIVAKARLADSSETGSAIQLKAEVEGQPVVFRFRNRKFVSVRAQKLTAASPSVFLVIGALSILAAAVDYRLVRELEIMERSVQSLERAAIETRRGRADQQSSWSDWTSVADDRLADNASCALRRLAEAGEPISVKLLEAGSGATHVTFASPLSERARDRIDPDGRLTWMDDETSRSQWVRFGSDACR